MIAVVAIVMTLGAPGDAYAAAPGAPAVCLPGASEFQRYPMPTNARQTGKRNHYRNEPDWMAAGYGPGAIKLISESAVANSFTATAGVSASAVSAAVGFNVSETRTLKVEYSYDAPDDKRQWTVQGGNEEFTYTYDIHLCKGTLDAGKMGSGQAVRVGMLVFRYYPSNEPPS